MNQLQKFILRAALGIILAVVLSRIFRPGAGVPMIIGLTILLVALAYVFEYLRRRKT